MSDKPNINSTIQLCGALLRLMGHTPTPGHHSPAEAAASLDAGEMLIVGVRLVTTPTWADNGRGRYDDIIGVLQQKTAKAVTDFWWANTDPSGWYEDDGKGRRLGDPEKAAEGEDVNGDGRRDLGRLPAGVYKYKRDSSKKYGPCLRPARIVQVVERDADHDGWCETRDSSGSSGQTILFHKGSADRTGSAGCQTLSPTNWPLFWKRIAESKQQSFYYVLLDPIRNVAVNQIVWSLIAHIGQKS